MQPVLDQLHLLADVNAYHATVLAEGPITDNLSVEITGNYSTFKTKVPTSPWPTNSKSNVTATALGAELALAWHW